MRVRRPVVWFRLSRRRSPSLSGRRVAPPRGPDDPEPLWSILLTYALITVITLTVVVVTGTPAPRVMPVTAPLRAPRGQGALDHAISQIAGIAPASASTWLIEGAPLIGWALGHLPGPWVVHWRAWLAAALAAVTATPLHSAATLMTDAMPALAWVGPAPPSLQRPAVPPGLDAVDPGLPGDHGRVWAVLGAHPLVGIYQTHSREAFRPALPDAPANPYSTDWPATVVQVGWWLAQDLHQHGVAAVQSRVDNMQEGVLASWTLSLQTAKRLLRWFPSVRILIDVHRSDLGLKETRATVHGHPTATLLLVVGSNQLLPNPHWQANLAFAMKLAAELRLVAPGILRAPGVEVAPYRYNQQLIPADILVEVGGPDNTLAEERFAVWELAAALAALVHAGAVPGR